MKMRLRAGLVILLSLAALRAGIAAYKSIRPYALSVLPEDIYLKYSTRLDNAAYCLKSCGGYVAVYDTEHPRTPLTLTVQCSTRGYPWKMTCSFWSFLRISDHERRKNPIDFFTHIVYNTTNPT